MPQKCGLARFMEATLFLRIQRVQNHLPGQWAFAKNTRSPERLRFGAWKANVTNWERNWLAWAKLPTDRLQTPSTLSELTLPATVNRLSRSYQPRHHRPDCGDVKGRVLKTCQIYFCTKIFATVRGQGRGVRKRSRGISPGENIFKNRC